MGWLMASVFRCACGEFGPGLCSVRVAHLRERGGAAERRAARGGKAGAWVLEPVDICASGGV